jgi:transposase-like protein
LETGVKALNLVDGTNQRHRKRTTPHGRRIRERLVKFIQIDEGKVREHLSEMVRGSVEETLNAMLQAEADQLCQAKRYERTDARKDTRAGHYQRKLHTKAGEVMLNAECTQTSSLKFETASTKWGTRRYLDMKLLSEMREEIEVAS